jgi:PAS domain S-box-containing protein
MPRDGVKGGRSSNRATGLVTRGRWVVIGVAALVSFALLLAASTVMLRGIAWSSELVNHTNEVRVQIERSLSVLVDAETAQRGYLLTGNDAYLEPYDRALDEMPRILHRLRTLTRDSPVQERHLDAVEALSRQGLSLIQRGIALRRLSGLDAAVTHVSTGRGRLVMDAFRRENAMMLAEEDRLLAARAAAEIRRIQLATLALVASSLLLALLVASGLALRRAGRRQERAAAQEREKEASERDRLARVIDAAPTGMILVDQGGSIVLANATAEGMFGYTRGELKGRSVELLVPERFRDQNRDFRVGFFAHPSARPMGAGRDLYGLRKDGSEVAIEIGLNPVEIPGSGPCALSAITDITERRRDETRRVFIEEATAALASSLDYEATLAAVTALAVPHMADWCAVDLLDADGTIRNVALAHTDPSKVAWARELRERYPPPPDARVGLPEVLRTGKAEMAGVLDSQLVEAAVDGEHLRILRALGIRSYMVVPLMARGEILGAITFVAAESNRLFGAADLDAARQLCDRAALAVQNARLFAAEKRAREWVSRLQAMTAGLAVAASREQIATVAVEEGMAAFGAASEGLWLLDESGRTLELHEAKGFAATSEERFRRIPLAAPVRLPITDAFRSGQPIWLESFDDLRRTYPELAISSRVPRGAFAFLPLVVDNRTIGAISVAFSESRRLDQDERDALVTLARLCAQALDRGRLFEATERARAEAERAVRAREDILAIVSHDLRNPLAAVSMKASMISRLSAGGESAGERVRQQVEGIIRAVQQMDRMVRDLLDLAKVESGHLFNLEPRETDATGLALQAVQLLEPLATARRLALETDLALEHASLLCDSDRILQVFSNLVGNAIKFTREGGTITISGRRFAQEVVFSVIDTGEGIPEDQLPNIFDPYWQAKADRKGIGLGLSVAKIIVEAHGGRIWASSRVGQGSTFSFALPALEGETRPSEIPGRDQAAGAEEPG